MRTRQGGLLLAALLIFCVACSSDLSRDDARNKLQSHIGEIASPVIEGVPEVQIDEILRPDETNRTVRFGAVLRWDSSVDSLSGLTATFQQSDEGWSLESYGSEMQKMIAKIVAHTWQAEYQPLLSTLDVLTRLGQSYQKMITQRADALVNQARQNNDRREALAALNRSKQILIKASRVPPRETLQARIQDTTPVIPDSVEWGVYQPEHEDQGGILWARYKSDTSAVCASALLSIGSLPIDYIWVDDVRDTCRGRGSTYVEGSAIDSAHKMIQERTGVLRGAE